MNIGVSELVNKVILYNNGLLHYLLTTCRIAYHCWKHFSYFEEETNLEVLILFE